MRYYNYQKRYFDEKKHSNLTFFTNDYYAINLIKHIEGLTKISINDKILEVGSGEGRFSIHMLKLGYDLTCVDISERLKEKFFTNVQECGLRFERNNFFCMSIEDFLDSNEGNLFDAIIGFFVLHHLEHKNLANIISRFKRILKPGGRICFLEPNRLNMLYFLQFTLLPGFELKKEIGIYRLSPALFRRILSKSGYENIGIKNFGFFPPQIINRWPEIIKFEIRLEGVPILKSLLPFLVVTAQK